MEKPNKNTKFNSMISRKSLRTKLLATLLVSCILLLAFFEGFSIWNPSNNKRGIGLAFAADQPSTTIKFPVNGTTVPNRIVVYGNSQKIPNGTAVWIVVYVTAKDLYRYYPMHDPAIVAPNGDWSCLTSVGGDDTGSPFYIIATLADQTAQQKILAYNALSESKTPIIYGGVTAEEWPTYGTVEYARTNVTLNTTYTFPLPSPPMNLSTASGVDSVTLNWSAAPSSNETPPVTYFKVYRGTSSGTEGQLDLTSSTSYIDTSVANSQTYYYYVTALSFAGESLPSNEINAQTSLPTPSPSPTPTPSPSPTPTPTPSPTAPPTPPPTPTPPEVKILNPLNADHVDQSIQVTGTAKNIGNNSVWIVVQENSTFYPNKNSVYVEPGGDWQTSTGLGGPQDGGATFYIYAIVANQTIQDKINEYNEDVILNHQGIYPGIDEQNWTMPEVYSKVTVIRNFPPTPEPSETPTPSPTPTPTPSPTPTPTPTPSPTPTPNPSANPTPTSTPTITPQTSNTPAQNNTPNPPFDWIRLIEVILIFIAAILGTVLTYVKRRSIWKYPKND